MGSGNRRKCRQTHRVKYMVAVNMETNFGHDIAERTKESELLPRASRPVPVLAHGRRSVQECLNLRMLVHGIHLPIDPVGMARDHIHSSTVMSIGGIYTMT